MDVKRKKKAADFWCVFRCFKMCAEISNENAPLFLNELKKQKADVCARAAALRRAAARGFRSSRPTGGVFSDETRVAESVATC